MVKFSIILRFTNAKTLPLRSAIQGSILLNLKLEVLFVKIYFNGKQSELSI